MRSKEIDEQSYNIQFYRTNLETYKYYNEQTYASKLNDSDKKYLICVYKLRIDKKTLTHFDNEQTL